MENKISESATTILMKYLEELNKKELKRFNVLLKECPVKEGYSNIPRARLENADYLEIADQLIIHYDEGYALEIAGELLPQIPRMDLLEQFKSDSQKYLDKNQNLRQTRAKDHNKSYKACMLEKFRFMMDKNIQLGENVSLKKRYSNLLIVNEHCPQAQRKHEILFSGREHLQIMSQRAGHSYSSLAALFDPDEEKHVPRTVVLQGVTGIGKTTTAQKIMVDWASGELFQDRFNYIFYINCREIKRLSRKETIAELLSHSCPGMLLSVREIGADPGKLLFIIDGFDELNIFKDTTAGNPSKETKKGKKLIKLIRKHFSQSYIIVTTRPTALEKLKKCVGSARFAEILGFSEEDRKEYFTKFFNSETQGAQAFNIVKGNSIVSTMCFVPMVCWIVCHLIKQQMEEKQDPVHTFRTTTSVYLSFLSSLLKQQSSDSLQTIHRNLQRLCALAKEGVWQQTILFGEDHLVKHDLDISAVQSLFLQNDIFYKATERENCYSFIHLSFQDFLAAMFYLLRENEERRTHTLNPITYMESKLAQIGVINSPVTRLLEASRTQKYLMLTVHFLFGLLNEETLNQMKKIFQWEISPAIKPDLLKWIKKGIKQDFSCITNEQMELFLCLYEIQDKEFVRRGTRHWKYIGISSWSLQREMSAMDFRALGFCLNNSGGVERVCIKNIKMKPEDLSALMPGLMTCSSLRMRSCSLTASCCAELSSVLSTNTSLKQLNLGGNELGDSGVRELCAGLGQNCSIKKLRLCNTGLTDACTEALCSALRRNRTLQNMNLSGNRFTEESAATFSEFKGRVSTHHQPGNRKRIAMSM